MAAPGERAFRVLVVDDDPRFLSTVRDVLTDEGYVVEIAANGQAATRRFHTFSPDVLVLDLVMPGLMDGIEVLAWLKKEGSQTPVVVLTNDDDWKALAGVIKLSKPCTLEQLLDSVAAAAASRGPGPAGAVR
jgi:DNA-binding response OmpR family regulator